MSRNARNDRLATLLCFALAGAACRSTSQAPNMVVPLDFDAECSAQAGYPGREIAPTPSASVPEAGEEDPALKAYTVAVAREVLGRQQAFLGCYGMELPAAPVQEGRLAVYFTVESDGSVSTSRVVESTLCPKQIGCCVANAIRRMRFRPPPDGRPISLEVPIVFDVIGSKSAAELGEAPSDPNCVP
jgi:TonB family protein